MGSFLKLKDRLRNLSRNLERFSRAEYLRDWFAGLNVDGGSRREVLGKDINESTALSIASVYACTLIIAETLATLDLNLIEKTSRKTRLADNEDEFYLFRQGQPNPNNTAVDYLENFFISAILNGNSYSYMPRSRGRVVELWNIHPRQISAISRFDKTLIYNWTPVIGETPLADGQMQKIVQGWDAIHFKRFSRDGVTGMSVLGAYREAMGLALAQEEYQTNLYKNGVMNKGVLESPDPMTTDQINDLSSQFQEQYSGVRHAGTAIVLPFGLKFSSITMTPEDAQMIESFKFTEQQLAKIFRVPLYKLQNHDHSTFSNVEHLAIEFVQDCIRPWAVRAEQCFNQQILTKQQRKRGLEFKFDLDLLLRGATKDRYEAHNIAINAGFKTRNEVRHEEDLDPIQGLDEILVPLNMVEESQIGQDQAQNTGNSGADPVQETSASTTDGAQNDAKQAAPAQKESNSKALAALCELYADAVRRYSVKVIASYSQGLKPIDCIVANEAYLVNQTKLIGGHLFGCDADIALDQARNITKITLDQVDTGLKAKDQFSLAVTERILGDVRGLAGLERGE